MSRVEINIETRYHNYMFPASEFKGHWWLPKNPDLKISGTLYISENGAISLELDTFFCQEFIRPDIILGISGNREITLYISVETNKGLGNSFTYFKSDYAFIGKHFTSPEKILFDSVTLKYNYLEYWISENPFRIKEEITSDSPTLEKADGTEKLKSWEIQYIQPENKKYRIHSQNAAIFLKFILQYYEKLPESVQMHNNIEIEISSDKAQHLNWFNKIIHNMENLLTILIGYPVYPLSKKASIKEKLDDGNIKSQSINIKHPIPNPTIMKGFTHESAIIQFQKIKDNFELYLNNWFDKLPSLQAPTELLLSTIYGSDIHSTAQLENNFLALTKTLESFHRNVEGGVYIEKKAYKDLYDILVKAIPNDTPTDLKQSLKSGRLKYGNEFSFRKRLNILLNDSIVDNTLNLLIKDKQAFISKIVDTRNFLTHYDDELRNLAASGMELNVLREILLLICMSLIMKEIDLPNELINNGISSSNRFGYLVHQA